MKKTIKTALSSLGLVAMVAGFSTNASAIAWTLSPDANTLAFGQTVVTGLNEVGFLDTSQPQGIYGAGFTVAGGTSQSVKFDSDLYSWDSYNAPGSGPGGTGYWDGFMVTVSTLGYYWDIAGLDPQSSNANTALWSWGGQNFADGILESYITAPGNEDTLTLVTGAPSLYYISFALDTKSLPSSDTSHPSYGSFHVTVPEPSILGLLGIGLLAAGMAGRARRDKDMG
jgi:PEP-CTERM motif